MFLTRKRRHFDPAARPAPSPAVARETTLADLARGETAVVARVEASSAGMADKLSARGLSPGAAVTVLHGTDPLVVASGCSRWGIARSEAVRIGVARLGLPEGVR